MVRVLFLRVQLVVFGRSPNLNRQYFVIIIMRPASKGEHLASNNADTKEMKTKKYEAFLVQK